jgi:hypothetical protein
MKSYFSLCSFWVMLTLSSCNPKVQFDGPMPPSRWDLPNIPKVYRGEYGTDEERWIVGKDSIWLDDEIMVNGEDFVLRKMAGYLVMSQPVPKTGNWEVRVIRREGDAFRMGEFEDREVFLKRAQTLMPGRVMPKKSQGTPGYQYHLLSPSAKEFRAMLKGEWCAMEDQLTPLAKGGVIQTSGWPPQSN